jgi:hypothetical protein
MAIVAFLFAMQVNAQVATQFQTSNRNINCNYYKVTATNNFELHILYKNDQVIYKEETDSVVLHNKSEIHSFTTELQKVTESLSEEKSNVYIEKPTYSLFKFDKGIIGIFVAISNPTGNVVASNNKNEAINLLNWLKSIDFSKD